MLFFTFQLVKVFLNNAYQINENTYQLKDVRRFKF